MTNKDEIIEIAKEIIYSQVHDEYIIFDMFSDSLIDNTSRIEEIVDEHSYFGGQEDLVSYVVLTIIVWIADDIKKEGLKLTKHILMEFFTKNKDRIYKKFSSEKCKIALRAIEKYLKSEKE